MPRLTRLALVLLLGAAGPCVAEEASGAGAWLDLAEARVLASPGWPQALEGFLPPGRRVEALALPLPPGPLLVLGLTGSDPAAARLAQRRLGDAQGVGGTPGLGGGYLVEASVHAGRPLALLLAEDAAALAAARFELETFTPEAKAGAARSLDMTQPDEQGGVRIQAGRRLVRPAFRLRALGGLEHQGSLLDAASAHANRLWLGTPRPVTQGRPRSLAVLAEHGVAPVAWTELRAHQGDLAAEAGQALADFRAWQAEGVRHFALLLPALSHPGGPVDARRPSSGTRAAYAAIVRQIVPALRPGGLEEILVVPPAGSDPALWPDLRGIPEALVGWYGPSPRPSVVTRAQAAQVACLAGVPVVFVETWMGDVWGLPSLPRGRDPALGEVLAGVVVLPGPGAVDAVAQAWVPQAAQATLGSALDDLLDCCVTDPSDAEAWLLAGAQSLEEALAGRFGAPLWQRDLPRRLRESAASLPPTASRVLAWYAPEGRGGRGLPGAEAWEAATRTAVGPAEVRAVSDGERVVLRVRVALAERPTRVQTSLITQAPEDRVDLPLAQPLRRQHPHGVAIVEVDATHATAFLTFERTALHGDPHPGRVLPLGLEVQTAAGAHRLSPSPGTHDALAPGGALIIVR